MRDIDPKPVMWLWPGRLARGKVSIIAGHPGLGKSQVTISIAAIVTTGGTWPVDRTRCECGEVVLLNAEDDAADTIRTRLEAAGADLSRCYILDAVRDHGPDGAIKRGFNLRSDLAELETLLSTLRKVALVVIDPLSAYLGGIDTHRNADVRALLTPLGELAARFDAAIVCADHLRKNQNAEALMRINGSVAFVAAARAAWLIAADRGNPERRLFLPLKNNLAPDQSGLAYRLQVCHIANSIETCRVMWEADAVTVTADEALAPQENSDDGDGPREEAKDWLKDLLKDVDCVDGKSVKSLASESGISESTLYRAAKELCVKTLPGGFGKPRRWHMCPMSAKQCHVCQRKSIDTHEKVDTDGGEGVA